MLNINLESSESVLDAQKLYDVIIVGGGPAGLSSAIYAARKGLQVGVIGEKLGGQVNDTSSVENYIGFELVTGESLAKSFEKHAKSLHVDITPNTKIKRITKEDVFTLEADNYMTYKSKTVIVATGSKSRKLGVIGEDEFYGKGVSYCAICDGPLFADKIVTVVGGGNSAVEAAIDLSKIAKKVILIHRSEFRADQILVDKLHQINNLEIHLNTQIEEIKGNQLIDSIHVTGKSEGEIKTDGVLVEIGYVPNSQFLDVEKNTRGEVIVDKQNQTSLIGLFAAGDVTTERFKQIVIAAGDGAKAALAANEYLNNI